MKDLITLVAGQVGPHYFTFDVNDEDDVRLLKSDAGPNDTPIAPAGGTFSVNVSDKSITLSSGHTFSGQYIIYRNTSHDTRNTFYPSGAIRADDLNKNFEQVMYAAEDKVPLVNPVMEDNLDMGGHRITNLDNSSFSGQNLDNDAINNYDDGDAASIGFVKYFFFDSGAETILDSEDWPAESNTHIATTKAVDYRVRSELQTALNTKVLADSESGITVTPGATVRGQVNPITLGIDDGGIEIEKINPDDINTAAETIYSVANNVPQATTDWTVSDDQIATLAAIAKRHDGYVQQDAPSGTDYLPGTIWLSEQGTSDGAEIASVNEFGEKLNKYFAIWNGTEWVGVAGGGTWINQNRLIWVDAGNGDDNNDGHRVISPMKTIQAAVNTAEDGDMIFVQPGVYSEYLPIDLGRKKNVSIIGLSMRSVFVHPNPTTRWIVDTGRDISVNSNKVMTEGPHGGIDATTSSEYEVMFQLGSGSFVANMTLSGMKARGTRGDANTDSFAHNPDNASEWQGWQGWYFAFSPTADGTTGNKVKFTKSPYVQNVTAFADTGIDNTAFEPHDTNLNPQDKGFAGDKTSGMTGGAMIVDGSVPHQQSPLRSFLTDAFTVICLDGPGFLVRNEGYAQLVSTFGHFCHYHAKSESGGMINMSNCTTDFGRYGLIADGQSTNAIFEGTVTSLHQNTKVIHVATTQNPSVAWAQRGSTIPVNHMVLKFGTTYYPIRSVSDNEAGGYNVELYTEVPNIPGPSSTVYFYLQSLITTGGHVFEFAGSGTDYRAHPDNGGQPNPNNQVITNAPGAVYISSTDHNGNFKVGTVFQVNSDAATTDVTGTFSVSGNATVGGTLNATTIEIGGVETKGSSTFFDVNDDIKDTSLPDVTGLPSGAQAYPSSVTLDAKGRVTAITAGTEPVTSVSVSDPITGDSTSKTPTIGVKTFGATETVDGNQVTILKGVVNATANDSGKFLKGDGTWASPTQASFKVQLDTNESNSTYVDLDLTDAATPANVVDTVTFVPGQNITLSRSNDQLTINALSANANVHVGSSSDLPASPSPGQLFWDIETGESYIYYSEAIPDPNNPGFNVGSDAQWIQFAPQQRGAGNGTVTSIQVTGGTGLSVDNANAVLSSGSFEVSLDDTAVTPAQYGSSSAVPQFSVDQQGRITAAGDVNIGALSTSAMPTGTFGPLRIDRTQSLAITKIFVPAGTSDGAQPPAIPTYTGPVTVVCDLTDADSLLVVGDRVTIANNTGNHAVNQPFLNATHTITDVVAEATVNNVIIPAHFKFVIADGVVGLHSADDTATQNLGTCTWIDNGILDVDRIPGLPGERLTSGTINANRLPSNIAKTNIADAGEWDADEIPSLAGDGSLTKTYLESVNADLTPELGGNLDVLSNKIVSSVNRDIKLEAHGTGAVVIEGYVDGAIVNFTHAGSGVARVPATYYVTGLAGNANGVGAAFEVHVGLGPTYPVNVTLTNPGNGFVATETITIPQADIGGGADLVITVDSVSTASTRGGKIALDSSGIANYNISFEAPTLTKNIALTLPSDLGTNLTNPVLAFSNLVSSSTDLSADLQFVEQVVYNTSDWSVNTPSADKAAGLVPATASGNTDNNKFLRSDSTWQTINIPTPETFAAGMIQWWPGLSANIPDGWIACDGRVYQYATRVTDGQGNVTTTYLNETNSGLSLKRLRDALAAGISENSGCIYDNQRDPSNTTISRPEGDWTRGNVTPIDPNNLPTFDVLEHFAVPDLRGEFIRGWDDGRQVDEDTTRDLGSAQGDQFQDHKHRRGGTMTGTFGGSIGSNVYTPDTGAAVTGTVTIEEATDFSAANPHRAGDETRPRNIAMIAIIKL